MAKLNGTKGKKNEGSPENIDESVSMDLLTLADDKKSAGIKSDAPKKLAPLQPRKTAPERKPSPSAEPKPKRRIVISNELPDYDAIRQEELEKDRRAKEEAQRKAREEAERKAREEAERKAREEAERKAREEAERKAREEAERKAREEAERKAREEAERKAQEEAERKAREEAERKAREEAERKAREEAEHKAREEAERKAQEEAERKAQEEAERKAKEEERARKAAEKKAKREERRKRRQANKKKTEEAEKRTPESDEFDVDEITEISQIDEDDDEEDTVGNFINNIRQDPDKVVADIESMGRAAENEEYTAEIEEIFEEPEEEPEEYEAEEEYEEYEEEEYDEEEEEEEDDRKKNIFERILDEDPDEIINERSEKTEQDRPKKKKSKKDSKQNFYKFCGLVFAVFACVGFITVVSKGISMLGGYTSGDSKKNSFESVVYPVVIMDIESFENPSELSSEQVITAAIWSMIMSDNAIKNYEMTFDVVKIPAVDVESYAVRLFGENIPPLNHATVGPAESRFWYNEETQSYNVPVAPVTYTYSPKIKGATKNGNRYTIVVDYIDELPEWLPQSSSKSVEFKLTETNNGYTIDSMKVLSTSGNGNL